MNPLDPILRDMDTRLQKVELGIMTMRGEVNRCAQMFTDMQREVSRAAAVFDQASAETLENIRQYQTNVGTVVHFLVAGKTEHDSEHADMRRRLDALERRQAG